MNPECALSNHVKARSGKLVKNLERKTPSRRGKINPAGRGPTGKRGELGKKKGKKRPEGSRVARPGGQLRRGKENPFKEERDRCGQESNVISGKHVL